MTNAFYVALTFKLRTLGSRVRAAEVKAREESSWEHLGVPREDMAKAVKAVVGQADIDVLMPFAQRLWNEPVWELKIAALSMMNLEHVSVNGELWRFVIDCGPQIDGPALADCLALVGRRCLRDDPARLDDLAKWPASSNKWMRYSALCFTTQWTEKGFDPAPVLEWVRTLAADKEQCVQDMIGDWIRKLGANDSNRRNMFLAAHGDELKPEVLAEGRR